MKNFNPLLHLSWIHLVTLLSCCYGSPYIKDFEVDITKKFDVDFDVPDEYWNVPDVEGSQVIQISQILIKRYRKVKEVTVAPWDGQTIPPDITVISLRLKFPHFVRNSRALSLHDTEEDLVKAKIAEIFEALLPTYSNFVNKEETIILESEDELPQATTALYFTDVYNSEALIIDMESKTAAIVDELDIVTLSIKAYAGGRISQSCSRNSDCITRGGECRDSKCRCGDRYEQHETTCIPDGLFDSPCQKTRECTGHNERCLDGFCACNDRYDNVDLFCVKTSRFGLNCTNAHDCELTEFQCKDSTCQCKDVYYTYEASCYLMVNYDDECELNEQCASSEHCSEDKRCACNAGLEYFEGIGCRTRKDIGGECILTEECNGDEVRCTQSICTCIEGKAQRIDGSNVCVRLLLTITYPLVLDSPWNPSYSNKNSAEYASLAAIVTQIYEGADIAGFIEVLSVDFSENTEDGKILSSTVFTANNPDAIAPDRRRRIEYPLNINGEYVKYDEDAAKQKLISAAQPLIQESLKRVAMQNTIDYQLILTEAYDDTQHKDPKSASYKKKVQYIKNMVKNAGVAGLESIKHVELQKNKEGHLAAVIQFNIKTPLATRKLATGNENTKRKRKADSEDQEDVVGKVEGLLNNDAAVKAVKLMEVKKKLKYYT